MSVRDMISWNRGRDVTVRCGEENMMALSMLGCARDAPTTMGLLLLGAAITMIAVADISRQANTSVRRDLRSATPTQIPELRSGAPLPFGLQVEKPLKGKSAHGIRAKGGRHDGEAMEKGSNR